ncbi:uncharacterized protein CANTADRAFT_116738 [Suhomyces tanzawaensis NRRL Y-17324]|uniref:Uncharacterized protein n=1 Tax=Suhomyces tanzawaensis NRRL Y-17324 TaxID=984487 RepID=A0A1E4SQB1_9ASCO|nr:uncharacterized protein CANTADRAFT_116738 [Suhomyces tanzawaensis NRRL Y-17324]ODV81685.1 hypothetical protein CANTADRAFT_116738 [Suhomyces tanzawaensis NRRL Y-17324]
MPCYSKASHPTVLAWTLHSPTYEWRRKRYEEGVHNPTHTPSRLRTLLSGLRMVRVRTKTDGIICRTTLNFEHQPVVVMGVRQSRAGLRETPEGTTYKPWIPGGSSCSSDGRETWPPSNRIVPV